MARMNEEGVSSSAEELKNKAQNMGQNIGQNVRDFTGQVSDAAQEQYENLKNAASDYYERGRQRAMDFEDSVEDYVREKPVQAILVAAGVGLLIGLLWRRH